MASNEPLISQYGNFAYEVISDNRQVGLFRARHRSETDANGKARQADPTADDMAEAMRHAELFACALSWVDRAAPTPSVAVAG